MPGHSKLFYIILTIGLLLLVFAFQFFRLLRAAAGFEWKQMWTQRALLEATMIFIVSLAVGVAAALLTWRE